MNYEMRMSAVKQWLKTDILPRFSAPNNVDKATAANDVAEAVNSNIPRVSNMDQFNTHLEGVRKHIIGNARSRTLPVPKDFIEACRETTKSKATSSQHHTYKACPYKITENRVKAGEAISSTWLTDRMIDDLIANTNLTMEDLKPYIVAHTQSSSGEDNEQNGIHRW